MNQDEYILLKEENGKEKNTKKEAGKSAPSPEDTMPRTLPSRRRERAAEQTQALKEDEKKEEAAMQSAEAEISHAPSKRPRPVRKVSEANKEAPSPLPENFFLTEESTAEAQSFEKKKKTENGEPKVRERKSRAKKSRAKSFLLRTLLCFGTFLALLLVFVVLLGNVLLNGPSATLRNQLVLSAKQASATKWLPGLFMNNAAVEQIVADSKKVSYDSVSMDEILPGQTNEEVDEWANAIDGIRYEVITMPTCKAYVLIIKDPSRVFVGTSSDFRSGKHGARIFDIAEKYQAVAAINGGEFADNGGVGTGDNPMGLTYSQGKKVWQDGLTNRTFIGIDADNKLVVSEGMNANRAEELRIRDGVCFQTGNVLLTNDGENITRHYANSDTGAAQRTAIGQRSDGAIVMIVTDGRTASSIGATHNDMIEVMLRYGAVTAAKLDGGSSAMMYYRNYFDLYHIDPNDLDEYQKLGLVNKYKAFTKPRLIPTYFIVGGSN